MTINTLVFDFGNVLLDIDIPRTNGQLQALAGSNWASAQKRWKAIDLFNEYECGKIEEDDFLRELQAGIGNDIAKAIVTDAWNAMLLMFPLDRLKLLTKLREKYKVYLLSNTNETHINWVYRHLDYKYNLIDFDTRHFDKAYYSHQIGMRKPNKEVFDFVAQDAELDLSTTMFFDDMKDNVSAAKKAGWQATLHDPAQDISETLKGLGII